MNDSKTAQYNTSSLYPTSPEKTSRETPLVKRGSRLGLLVLNFGGPETLEDVESFLFHLFNDPEVIRLPFGAGFQRWFAGLVSKRRAPKTQSQYRLIGDGSPLNPMTFKQVDALKAALAKLLLEPPPVYVAMRYTPPTCAEVLEQIRADGIDELLCLALYPHFSFTTTGSSFRQLREVMARAGSELPTRYITAWYKEPDYLEAMADLISKGLEAFESAGEIHILFSAHGLPASYVRKGDPYQRQVQESVVDIIRTLEWKGDYSLAYQSKVGPVRWLGPSVEQELDRLARAASPSILVVPLSFVGDHIETLYEIDQLFAEHAKALSIREFRRTPALDTHPSFIQALAKVVARAVEGPPRKLCVRCQLPKADGHFEQKKCPDCGFRIPEYFGC